MLRAAIPARCTSPSYCEKFCAAPTRGAAFSFQPKPQGHTTALCLGVCPIKKSYCGGGEIRTHGGLPHSCFQDRCIRPLCHSSNTKTIHCNGKKLNRAFVYASCTLLRPARVYIPYHEYRILFNARLCMAIYRVLRTISFLYAVYCAVARFRKSAQSSNTEVFLVPQYRRHARNTCLLDTYPRHCVYYGPGVVAVYLCAKYRAELVVEF